MGYESSATTRGALGAMHLAEEKEGELRDAGAIGLGFSVQAAMERLDAIGRPKPEVMGLKIKGAPLVTPG